MFIQNVKIRKKYNKTFRLANNYVNNECILFEIINIKENIDIVTFFATAKMFCNIETYSVIEHIDTIMFLGILHF